MKNAKLFGILILPLLLLSACSADQSASTSKPGTSTDGDIFDPGMDLTPDPIKVYFYASASEGSLNNYFKMVEVLPNGLIPAPTENPTSTDPAFDIFIGWSDKPVAVSAEDLWNFEEDHLPEHTFDGMWRLYGQWDTSDTL